MFTWNFQYISKARLEEIFNHLALNSQKGEILIRIHTAIHLEDEAVDLARFVKNLVPGAHIFGTSTSAIIGGDGLMQNQCLVSVTQMARGHIRSAMVPSFDETTGEPVAPDELCCRAGEALDFPDAKFMLAFFTREYRESYRLIEECNTRFPGVQMTGGVANTPDVGMKGRRNAGFVFNENGWSDRALLLAAIGGDDLECFSSCATGAQAIGEEVEVTDSFATCILAVNGEDAAEEYRAGIGDILREKPQLTSLFPYMYAETGDIPIAVKFYRGQSLGELYPADDPAYRADYAAHPQLDAGKPRELLVANHSVPVGKKLRRAFIYDRKIITDNRALFQRIENFEKAETIFAYTCIERSMLYSNCVKWELSAYKNSNLGGCITDGEIAFANGKNTFANCSFVVSAMGEDEASQQFNPYVFSHTDSLAEDNRQLLSYLMEIESGFEQDRKLAAADDLHSFVRDCELKLLYSPSEELPNTAALNMDMKLRGYDRVCIINVANISGMKAVFPKKAIDLTRRNYIARSAAFARSRDYGIYALGEWQLAVAAPSYLIKLSEFSADMEALQHELFQTQDGYIAIVPIFCVIDDCTVENLMDTYNSSRVEMAQKNTQFLVNNARSGRMDVNQIHEQYHMVNVINYAITHDKVLPYFQGIYDNQNNKIHHYESLMRLEDENGRLYYPEEFLGVARSFGQLYDSISRIMIRKVFDKFRNSADKSVSINLGIRDIKNREIVEYIYEFLPTVAHPENFVFEILENEDVDEYEYLLDFVERIHSLGGRISIDDFGSGYSNLQHVVSIPFDYLKIDGSIIKKCCEDKESENLMALIANWRSISSRNVRIIAEYVENENIQRKLKHYGIDYSQGFLFSTPSPDIPEE